MMNAPNATPGCLAALVLAVGLGLSAGAPPAAAQGQPSIAIEPQQLDFGKMEQFEARSATLTLRNDGNAPLHLGEIEVTCGCTAASPPREVLAPGESTEVTITFNSEKFRGEQLKYIKVHSDDPFHGIVDVPIVADIRASLIVSPAQEIFSFRKLPAGVSQTETLRFSTQDVDALVIKPVRYRQELFSLSVEDDPSGDPRAKIAVLSVRPDAPLGTFREIVGFETNVPIRPNVNFEIGGAVVAPVLIDPEKVNLRYLQHGEVVTRTFKVQVQRGFDIRVTGAEIDLPGFKVKEITPNPENNWFAVTIEGAPLPISDERAIAARGRMMGTLRVSTDDPDYPELSATVTYFLKL